MVYLTAILPPREEGELYQLVHIQTEHTFSSRGPPAGPTWHVRSRGKTWPRQEKRRMKRRRTCYGQRNQEGIGESD
jgi:hypothetical protein